MLKFSTVPWVPEPQNLNERKLVRGKESRKKGATFFPSLFFSFYYFLALVPRVILQMLYKQIHPLA